MIISVTYSKMIKYTIEICPIRGKYIIIYISQLIVTFKLTCVKFMKKMKTLFGLQHQKLENWVQQNKNYKA